MKKLLLGIAFVTMISITAAAQDYPKFEIYGGYQLTSQLFLNMHGFNASLEGNLNKYLGVVGEFGFGRESGELLSTRAYLNEYTYMGGPRLGYRKSWFRIYTHALFGGYTFSGGINSALSDSSREGSYSNLAMAFGLGVNIAVNKTISIKPFQIDWLRLSLPNYWNNQARYTGGVIFKFGQ